MRIGVYFTASKNDGGVYQYSVTFLESFSKIKNNDYYIFSTSRDVPTEFRKLKNFHFVDLYSKTLEKAFLTRDFLSNIIGSLFPIFFKITYKLGLFKIFTIISTLANKNTIKSINSKNLDLIFYPTTSNLSFLTKAPSVVTIHDLHHKLTPWFKETTAGGRKEMRDYTFSNIIRNSYMVLTESEEGKEDVLRFYKADSEKVMVLPMLPPSYLSSRVDSKEKFDFLKKNDINKNYLFYPAKFWPHKNHLRIIKALNLLKSEGIILDLVLTGSKDAAFSTYDEVMELAKKLGVSDQIKYLGYVDNNELSILYKGALCLIMPTFFGATNLPVLEAWKVGTAVVYSDIRGCRNQLGGAGLLVNPNNYKDIANKIKSLYNEPKLREVLIKKGKKRLMLWTEKKFIRKITDLIKGYE